MTYDVMNFDKLLSKCGDAGRYQYLMLLLLGYIAFTSTVHYYSQNIIGFVPQHWCFHEQLADRSFDQIAAVYAAYGKAASCTRLESVEFVDGSDAAPRVTLSNQTCERWIYKYDYGFRSMNAELNWVCQHAYKARIGQSLFFIGSLLGTFIFGMLGDRIGRVRAVILANQCGFVGDFLTTYASNLTQFSAFRCISGFAATANYYLMFILVLEYLAPRLRNLALAGTLGLCCCLGGLVAPWLSVLAGNWRIYLTFSALLQLIVALFYFVVQESAQWLITRNNVEGAIARLKHIAHFNGRQVPAADFEAFRVHCASKSTPQSQQQQKATLLDLLQLPHLRRTALIVVFTFMLTSLSFNTISRNVEGLGLSPFVIFSLFAVVVVPSGFLQGALQSRLGRKATCFLAFLTTGLLSFGLALALSNEQNNATLLLLFALPTRLGISMCYTGTSQYCSELLPTCVRSRGMATAHLAAAAASFSSPYLIHLGTSFAAAPPFILTALLLVAAFSTLQLPETNNRQLPITLAEGEAFGKGESMLSFDCWRPHDDDLDKQPAEQLKLQQRQTTEIAAEAEVAA
ncbi:organic cation transporter protein isoform X1 [Drosophila busckii]|uniref:organic cation transporter protein isoform X1 n=1 Tax=Drosophila busckii TaxID=30019 RepID=UPI00083EB7FC|nr:organic cation transporter protein isoform X1 [Drosophila busckii]